MNYVKASIRLEGEVNRDWKLTLSDGAIEKFYSIEGSPQRLSTDEYVYDTDPNLGQWLEQLSFMVDIEPDEVVEYDIDLITNNITITSRETVGGDDE